MRRADAAVPRRAGGGPAPPLRPGRADTAPEAGASRHRSWGRGARPAQSQIPPPRTRPRRRPASAGNRPLSRPYSSGRASRRLFAASPTSSLALGGERGAPPARELLGVLGEERGGHLPAGLQLDAERPPQLARDALATGVGGVAVRRGGPSCSCQPSRISAYSLHRASTAALSLRRCAVEESSRVDSSSGCAVSKAWKWNSRSRSPLPRHDVAVVVAADRPLVQVDHADVVARVAQGSGTPQQRLPTSTHFWSTNSPDSGSHRHSWPGAPTTSRGTRRRRSTAQNPRLYTPTLSRCPS